MRDHVREVHDHYANLTATIAERKDGRWAVALKDNDAGQTLPTYKIFDEYPDALMYAHRLTDPPADDQPAALDVPALTESPVQMELFS